MKKYFPSLEDWADFLSFSGALEECCSGGAARDLEFSYREKFQHLFLIPNWDQKLKLQKCLWNENSEKNFDSET